MSLPHHLDREAMLGSVNLNGHLRIHAQPPRMLHLMEHLLPIPERVLAR